MIPSPSSENSQHLNRIDKFKLPPSARDELLARVRDMHRCLKSVPGFVRYALFEQASGPGTFNFVTLVEFQNAQALGAARKTATAREVANGFNSQEFLARLGIEVDTAIYREALQALS
jgi:quinol monooxygenase YgiN